MKPMLCVAAVLMLMSAVLLVAGVGSSALWIAVIAVGVAMVAIERLEANRAARR